MLEWDLSFHVMNYIFFLDTISSTTWAWNSSSITERNRIWLLREIVPEAATSGGL